MKRVTLTTLLTPDKKIQAIKNLREASLAPGAEARAMGLKEAKDIVDGLQYDNTPADVEVHNTAVLGESFNFVVTGAVDTIDKDLVLDFVLDVLAECPPTTAQRIMNLKTYRLVKEALR